MRRPPKHHLHIAITVGVISASLCYVMGFGIIALVVGTGTNLAWLWEDKIGDNR